jgi:Histone RNA hairpin-binding protein RNA-binding domain
MSRNSHHSGNKEYRDSHNNNHYIRENRHGLQQSSRQYYNDRRGHSSSGSHRGQSCSYDKQTYYNNRDGDSRGRGRGRGRGHGHGRGRGRGSGRGRNRGRGRASGRVVETGGRETDPRRLEQRQKQIDIGKNTRGYDKYSQSVAHHKRHLSKAQSDHPLTPDIYQRCSKRAFDGKVREWRRLLHMWDPDPGHQPSISAATTAATLLPKTLSPTTSSTTVVSRPEQPWHNEKMPIIPTTKHIQDKSSSTGLLSSDELHSILSHASSLLDMPDTQVPLDPAVVLRAFVRIQFPENAPNSMQCDSSMNNVG